MWPPVARGRRRLRRFRCHRRRRRDRGWWRGGGGAHRDPSWRRLLGRWCRQWRIGRCRPPQRQRCRRCRHRHRQRRRQLPRPYRRRWLARRRPRWARRRGHPGYRPLEWPRAPDTPLPRWRVSPLGTARVGVPVFCPLSAWLRFFSTFFFFLVCLLIASPTQPSRRALGQGGWRAEWPADVVRCLQGGAALGGWGQRGRSHPPPHSARAPHAGRRALPARGRPPARRGEMVVRERRRHQSPPPHRSGTHPRPTSPYPDTTPRALPSPPHLNGGMLLSLPGLTRRHCSIPLSPTQTPRLAHQVRLSASPLPGGQAARASAKPSSNLIDARLEACRHNGRVREGKGVEKGANDRGVKLAEELYTASYKIG